MLHRLSRWSVAFPDPNLALTEPNGLLAIGGDLSPKRLEAAYRSGIFPWFESGGPILWWSPDPRALLCPGDLRVTRSLRRTLTSGRFEMRVNSAFAEVVSGCAGPRQSGHGTWITASMRDAYVRMHELGLAHSIETWADEQLVGGLYGLCFGRAFFGESMFSRVSDASKCAFVTLTSLAHQLGLDFIDCQLPNPHLESLGARTVTRVHFLEQLVAAMHAPTPLFPSAAPGLEVLPWAR